MAWLFAAEEHPNRQPTLSRNVGSIRLCRVRRSSTLPPSLFLWGLLRPAGRDACPTDAWRQKGIAAAWGGWTQRGSAGDHSGAQQISPHLLYRWSYLCKKTVLLHFQSWRLYVFSCPIALTIRTHAVLNGKVRTRQFYPVSDCRGKVFSLLPLSLMFSVDFFLSFNRYPLCDCGSSLLFPFLSV